MDESTKAFSLSILHTLNRERNAFGLREKDFARYRKHCASKLHKLRHSSHLTHGSGKAYKKTAPITASTVKDIGPLNILLFEAERSLTASHELRVPVGGEALSYVGRKEQISKLRRALGSAGQLLSVVQSLSTSSPTTISSRTLVEATVYHLGIQAELAFEKRQYETSVASYVVRRKLLGQLSEEAVNSQERVLADQEMDTSDPLIRFCAYKLGRKDSHDIEGIVADFDDESISEILPSYPALIGALKTSSSARKAAEGASGEDWNAELVPGVQVRNLELVKPMTKAKKAMHELRKGYDEGKIIKAMKVWDRVLSNLGEAEEIARRLVESEQDGGSRYQASSSGLAHQHILKLLLEHRIRRDHILIGQLSRSIAIELPLAKGKIIPQSKREDTVKTLTGMIKLYDAIIQGLQSLRELGIVESDAGKRNGVEGTEAYFKATKCYTLCNLHLLMPVPSYPSVIQLTSQAEHYLSIASEAFSSTSPATLIENFLSPSQLDAEPVTIKVKQMDLAAKKAWMTDCIPKQTIFDIAFNHIDLPMEDLEKAAGRLPTQVPAKTVVQQVVEVAADVKQAVVATTNDDDDEAMDVDQDEEPSTQSKGKSGWFGGLWGGKK